MLRLLCTTALVTFTLASSPARADDAPTTTDNSGDVIVTARRLDAARESIKPSLGASSYSLSNANIANLPGSDSQPLNDILLQLPGVSQDGFGQFHVRDDHNGIEYRINGTILPEGIAVFGQTLSPRLIDKLDLITGALPAQYGLRTAGIVDITTKTGLKNGVTLGLYGGSHETFQPSIEVAGSGGGTSYFVSGSYIHNNLGIENVNAAYSAIHDKTDQINGFAYVDHILDPDNRISFTGGYTNQHFQIPNPTGLQPDPANNYAVNGISTFPSDRLNENQVQATGFGIFSLLHTKGDYTLQASVFVRSSALDYRPDPIGELLFNGLAQAAHKQDFAVGTQIESVYKLGTQHTLRGGVIIQRERSTGFTDSSVFPTDNAGAVIPNAPPVAILDNSAATQVTYSAYLQDEWKLMHGLVINYGARFDENDGNRNERQLSPRVNLVWEPSYKLTIHAGYARYFSPPPFELVASKTLNLFANTSAAPPPAPTGGAPLNTTPFAERENYFDVGFQQKIGRSITVGLDGYYRLSTNLLDEGQFGAPIILTPFNYATGRVRGVELALNYAHGGWSAYGNLAVAKAQGTNIVSSQFNFTPQVLAYIANHYIYLDHDQTLSASAGVSYHFRTGTLEGTRLGADFIYGSGLRTAGSPPAFVPNGNALPNYATVNLSAGHKFKRLGLDVRVDVTNVFDKVYEIRDGSGVGVGAPQFGARRGAFIGLTQSF